MMHGAFDSAAGTPVFHPKTPGVDRKHGSIRYGFRR